VRRRLKAAVRGLPPGLARPAYDYVLIARAGAVTCPFRDLERDLVLALGRVHRTQPLAAKPGNVGAGPRSGAGRQT
jgi:ribonuclease P protein component